MRFGFADFPTGDGNHTAFRVRCLLAVFQLDEVQGHYRRIEVQMQGLLGGARGAGHMRFRHRSEQPHALPDISVNRLIGETP